MSTVEMHSAPAGVRSGIKCVLRRLEVDVRADATRSSVLVKRRSGVQIVERRSDGLESGRSIDVDRPLSGDQLGNVKDICSLQNPALQREQNVTCLMHGGR